jgi:hypothetical protein
VRRLAGIVTTRLEAKLAFHRDAWCAHIGSNDLSTDEVSGYIGNARKAIDEMFDEDERGMPNADAHDLLDVIEGQVLFGELMTDLGSPPTEGSLTKRIADAILDRYHLVPFEETP